MRHSDTHCAHFVPILWLLIPVLLTASRARLQAAPDRHVKFSPLAALCCQAGLEYQVLAPLALKAPDPKASRMSSLGGLFEHQAELTPDLLP